MKKFFNPSKFRNLLVNAIVITVLMWIFDILFSIPFGGDRIPTLTVIPLQILTYGGSVYMTLSYLYQTFSKVIHN